MRNTLWYILEILGKYFHHITLAYIICIIELLFIWSSFKPIYCALSFYDLYECMNGVVELTVTNSLCNIPFWHLLYLMLCLVTCFESDSRFLAIMYNSMHICCHIPESTCQALLIVSRDFSHLNLTTCQPITSTSRLHLSPRLSVRLLCV